MNLGIPDCIVAIENHFHLIELKVAQPNGRVRISPHQIAFHNAHKGCPTWIFVQHNKGRKIHLLVYEGWKAYTLVDLGILLPPDHEQKYPLDWNKVEKYLTMFKN